MARYAAFRKRDLLVALACAKQAGIPISSIKFTDDKGFEIIVGEPEVAEPAPPPRRVPLFDPISTETVHHRRRRVIAETITLLQTQDRPVGVGTVVDAIVTGKRTLTQNDREAVMSMGDGIGWRESLARLVERVLDEQQK
jgi:hypothetical protein